METYYQKNREKLLAYSKKYRTEHPDYFRDYAKKYYKEHSEHRKDYSKKYYAEHSDEIREDRSENLEYYRKRDKKYRENPKNAKRQKEYYERWYKENGRNRADNYQECILEYHKAFPERGRIKQQVQYAIKTGKIKRPQICPKCGRKIRIHAHHFNYEHFMNFIWLCASCHKKEHNITKGVYNKIDSQIRDKQGGDH